MNLDKKDSCNNCNGTGKIWIFNEKNNQRKLSKCKECLGTGNLLFETNQKLNASKKELDYLEKLIPSKLFRDTDFNDIEITYDDTYLKLPEMSKKDISLVSMISTMKSVIDMIGRKTQPKNSYFFFSPFDYINRLFVYNAIKKGWQVDFPTSPLLDIQEVHNWIIEGEWGKLNELSKYKVIFAEITQSYSIKHFNHVAIDKLLRLCASKGIPLILISPKSEQGLVSKDRPQNMVTSNPVKPYYYGMLENKGISPELGWVWYNNLSRNSSTQMYSQDSSHQKKNYNQTNNYNSANEDRKNIANKIGSMKTPMELKEEMKNNFNGGN